MLTLRQQSGVMLLEALIGVLLFSVGLIAMMGLQANALATVNETKFRGEAAFIAEQFISDMRNDTAYANTVDPAANPPLFPTPGCPSVVPPATVDPASCISPYTINASKYPTAKTSSSPTAPATNAAVATKQTYLTQKTAYTMNRFYFAAKGLPGATAYTPIVKVTPCVRTAWTAASICPGPTNGLLGTDVYGAVVEIEMQWKLPTASPTSEPRKYSTVAYIMLESTP